MNLTNFKNWLTLNKDSEKTVYDYYTILSHFFKHYKEFNQETINEYLFNITQKKSANTFNKYKYALISYAEFSEINIKFPKKKKIKQKEKPYIAEIEMQEIASQIDKIFSEWYRAYIIFKFMFYSGMRKEEIVNLIRKDVNLENETITVQAGKNYKMRILPLYPSLKKDLEWYFKQESEEINCFNTSIDKINYIFTEINNQLQPKTYLYPHIMRHSSAHWFYYITGKDIIKTQQFLGHANIETTRNYLGIREEDIINVFKKVK